MISQTLYDKIWQSHVISDLGNDNCLIYIDRHLVHEVTSPQAFDGLRASGRKVRRPDLTLAVCDHNIPTTLRDQPISDPDSRIQVATINKNCQEFDLTYFGMTDNRQGIVHVVGPEQGFTLPALTIVCGDSHTATHGAFGALAFGIGTSEVEHVLATQSLVQKRSRNMRITVNGQLAPGVGAKDIILAIIGRIGTAGATGHVIEYAGDTIERLSMEERMTVCNMSIEAGARAGMIAPDEKTIAYLKGRPMSPSGEKWDQACAYWQTLKSDPDATFDIELHHKAEDIPPLVTWGTSPEDVMPIDERVPDPSEEKDPAKRQAMERSLAYMGLNARDKISEVLIDKVFIGSCTNGRISDLRSVARIVKGRKVAANVQAIIVPGSGLIKAQAEAEGLNIIFREAGFEWREPGCSMCLGMNDDRLNPGERCATTSNRNFEGRQGKGGRSHLMSPPMAALAAVSGHLADIRQTI